MAENAKTVPTILVILGVTGDLFRRKIAPALFHLYETDRLPQPFSVIGFARRDLSDKALRDLVREAVAGHLDLAAEIPNSFLDLCCYVQGFFERPDDFQKLAKKIGEFEADWQVCANKLFYLAVPPGYYRTIFEQLAASGLTKPCAPGEGWTRVLVEKPLGKDLKEAELLDRLLGELFQDEQVYRIDHYLAKEMLQNILTFRFANNLLEHAWNKDFIERIEVRLLERIGVEERGDFYDGLGALLDVGQNHLLQMLALVTMDDPASFSPEAIRSRRAEVLGQLKPLGREQVRQNTVRGQYATYRREPGVDPNSTTETYFKIKAVLRSPRWRGVPVFLESGKKLPADQKEIVVTFRHPVPCFCPEGAREHYKNRVYFRIEPKPGIAIQFWAKKPGPTMDVREALLSFDYGSREVEHPYTEEYTKLLFDCIAGDQTLFVSSDEAMAGWRFIDPIVTAWHENAVPLHTYRQDQQIIALAEAALADG